MNNEELMEILRNFTEKQVNELPEKGKMVFYAIMDIADQRDELKNRINKATEYIENDLKSFLYGIEYKTLMKILKGEENVK